MFGLILYKWQGFILYKRQGLILYHPLGLYLDKWYGLILVKWFGVVAAPPPFGGWGLFTLYAIIACATLSDLVRPA
jgi:hypothetical protein